MNSIIALIPIMALWFLIVVLIYINYPRKVIHISDRSDGWLSIIEHPIPDDLTNFLATDGKEVRDLYQSKYNRFGKPIMGVSKEIIITHWMPYPNPPKEGK